MPLQIDAERLAEILRAAAIIHTQSECHVAIGTDEIRLQSHREDRSIYFEHSLPYPEPFTPAENETGSFWIELESINQFLRRTIDDDVRLTFPFEHPDSSIVFESHRLTYRSQSLIPQHGHYLPDVPASEPVSSCLIRHGAFDQAVSAADIIGGEIRIRVVPETRQIEFFTEGDDGSDCTYIVPASDIKEIQGSAANLTISIETLRDFTPIIPESNLITLKVFRNHLQYTVRYPSTDATLRLYIAERLSAVPG